MNVLPASQQAPYVIFFRVADFCNKPAARTQSVMRLRDQPSIDFHSFTTGEDSDLWLELPYLFLHFIGIGFTYIRRIGDDEVEFLAGVDREQIGFPEKHLSAQSQACSIGSRHFQRIVRDIAGMDFR